MMNILKIGAAVLATATAFALPVGASAQSRGKVLVVMSSAHALDLRDGKKYSTGYYLNEFVVPYRKLVEAGYEPVIANPNGDMPMMDANSNDKLFFGGDDAARADALKYAQGIAQLKHPKTLASVVAEGTGGYVGLFIPGGHAPLPDGRIEFEAAKHTGRISDVFGILQAKTDVSLTIEEIGEAAARAWAGEP